MNLVRVLFQLEPGSHGGATERLWAESLGQSRYRLQNSPFYVYGVSFEDVVLCMDVDGQPTFERVLLFGGHSTYRLALGATKLDSETFQQYWAPLQERGCSFEGGPVLAVDVPPHADIHVVYGLLQAGEDADVWEFEEGHCGHV